MLKVQYNHKFPDQLACYLGCGDESFNAFFVTDGADFLKYFKTTLQMHLEGRFATKDKALISIDIFRLISCLKSQQNFEDNTPCAAEERLNIIHDAFVVLKKIVHRQLR